MLLTLIEDFKTESSEKGVALLGIIDKRGSKGGRGIWRTNG